ncbi:hypothetical protein [Psychrobacter sp. ANT_H3]|uniref:hypothetical protein n=1 Tax=Psychrobacter sp. ANT_H3 TaxID=3019444 RepID=UPI0022F152A3|nr:hypothetical protein [Psychrobacter sp. ANT_H3]MDA5132829.1 hypothetical protein [Psychrobacter sp. ANT_H3]
MVNLSTFQQYLSIDARLSRTLTKSIDLTKSFNKDEQHLLKWAALLPMQTEAQQTEQLEKVLTELRVAAIDDRQRLTLLNIVLEAANKLIAMLRQHYIYEANAFNDYQLGYVVQVKSLYYLMIMVYDGVIQREITFLKDKKLQASNGLLQRYLTNEKALSITLAIATYQTLLMYQKLLFEEALCYQKPVPYLWSNINQLYYMACQQQTVDIDLSSYIMTHCADNIHQLYGQLCLHSLLNVRAMRRATVLMVQRLLLEWSEHLIASIEPQTETKVFVNLHSDNPPTYLTAHSAINPYDAHHDCVFIELAPLVTYLKSRRDTLIEEGREGVESSLMNTVAITLSYRYIQPPLTLPIRQSAKQQAHIITGFNDIHYHVSYEQSLSTLIAAKYLPEHQQPRYDTLPKKLSANAVSANTVSNNTMLGVETFDSDNALSDFRTLRLLPDSVEPAISVSRAGENTPKAKYNSKKVKAIVEVAENDTLNSIAPPPLRTMSLFLLCRSENPASTDWSIGVVRWLNLDLEKPEIDWQVLGHQLIACGIRLHNRDNRSRHFVPAFVVGDDEQLQTPSSLIMPTSHFQVGDRVMMRINTKQKTLRLVRRLMMTDEFSQYEVAQL